MADPNRSNDPKPNSEGGSAFDTDELRPISVAPQPEPVKPSDTEGYDLVGGPLPDDDDLPQPVPIPIPAKPVERPKAVDRSKLNPKLEFARPDPEGSSEFEGEIAEVHEVWSRWAESGPDFIRVGVVGLGTLILAWLLSGNLVNSFFVLMLGGAAMIVLSYPMLITLERPVRITPEQAVTDFFGAASHHFPHYRRMWLLLSSLGRESGGFETFDEFKAYWKARIDGWKQSKGANKFVPLKFDVESFRADKSAGKESSRAEYSVAIYLRDREAEGPIETVRMVHTLVKGPDRMWYMNRSVLGKRSK